MKNHLIRLLALCAAGAMPLAAASAEAEPAPTAQGVEAEIREELSELRARLQKLEAMLNSLDTAASEPAEQAVAEAPAEGAPAATVAELAAPADAEPVATNPVAVVADAEPSQEMPVGVVSSGGQTVSFTGLLDTYLTYNTNKPADGTNTLYYTNPNSRGFGLNQAKLEIDASGDGPIGFRSDIWFGSGARLFRDGLEPGPLEDVIYLQQAYGYYQFDNGAELDVGLFGTIAGLEVAESHLNWNYTRGILWAWNEPFSHLGAKYSVPVTDTFTATFMLVNGFDNAFDQNSGKSYGLQGSFAPNDRFNTTFTWINGPETWGHNEGWLKNASWNFYAMAHERFEIMANLDYIQASDGMASATSWGMGGYARAHLTDQVRLAYRYEFMDDTEARSTGVEQMLKENTLTFEVQPVRDDPRFLTRIEWRRDWSDVPFFAQDCCLSEFAKSQNTITLGLMWVFGPK